MKKEHLDSELYEILHFEPKISTEVQNKISTAYEQIKNNEVSVVKIRNKHNPIKKKRHAGFYLGFAAALILALGFLGFSNPVLAGKIPFIGRIFGLIEDKVGYPGNFSENSVPISVPESVLEKENTDTSANTMGDTESPAPKTNVYSQTAGDITITLSEASYTEMSLYFSVELYSEEGFPEDFDRVNHMPDYILSYNLFYMYSSQNFDFSGISSDEYDIETLTRTIEEGMPMSFYIEGTFSDSHTFLGIIRVDLDELRRRSGVDDLPPEFIYTFTIDKFWGDLDETKDIPLKDPETGEEVVLKDHIKKYYEGPWSFTLPVALDQTGTQVREIMETNADGIGISKVIKTRYEIKADLILPENADAFDYFVVITDADGEILDSQGNVAEIYSVFGRNTDTVHVYVVDYFTYMDECNGDNDAYILPEKALFQTTIEW